MSIGHKIIEYISDANLVSPRCVQDESHDIINFWSSSAPEQLEALVESELKSLKPKTMNDVKRLIESTNFNAEVIDHQSLRIEKLKHSLNDAWKLRSNHNELWALIMNALSEDNRLSEESPKPL